MRDNGHLIKFYASAKAAWGTMHFDGKIHYLALNRAARRCLQSNKFQTRMKKYGIVIDLKEMAVV